MPDHASPAVTRFAAMHAARPILTLRKFGGFLVSHHPTGPDGFFDRRIHRMELVIPGNDLVQPVAVRVFFEHDEVLQQIQEPALFEDPRISTSSSRAVRGASPSPSMLRARP